MVVLMDMKEWEEEQGLSGVPESYREEEEKSSRCACGRAVCCGKHKGCCHKKKEKIRFIKGRNKEL